MTTVARDRATVALTATTLAAAVVVFALAAAGRFGGRKVETAPGEALYREVVGGVLSDFVVEPDRERLVYGAVKGILAELDDPHAKAYPPEEWEEFRRETKGESVGVGIEAVALGDAWVVAHVGVGTSAERAGVRAGMRILEVAGKAVDVPAGLATAERALKGAEGTRVALVVSGRTGAGSRPTTLERVAYEASPVYGRLLDAEGGIGEIRIGAFRSGAAEAVRRTAEGLKRRGAKKWILDLRFNRGGSFDPAVEVADLWLSAGTICRTRGRNRAEEYVAKPGAPFAGDATAVLVNGTTASAAEVVAGALQDWSAALLLGEPTYGKGVVQEVVPFATWAGGMKLTVAQYYTPSGRAVEGRLLQKKGDPRGGIHPDVRVPVDDATRDRLRRGLERFHWDAAVREEVEAREAETERRGAVRDAALEAALRLLRGGRYDAGAG